MTDDRTSLAYWFPKVEAAGLRVPRTHIARTDADLVGVLDGHTPDGWDSLIAELTAAGHDLGWPVFLRTGHGSGKHDWDRTCYVQRPGDVERHVAALVEWSVCADMWGLPTDVWAVREMIPTARLFRCEAYGRFPVAREFRMFVRDGHVEHTQPYWPPDAIEQGRPSQPRWREMLAGAAKMTQLEYARLLWMALAAGDAVGGGYWSVDLLEDRDGEWWLTDMAEGDRSFRWEPTT